MVSLSLSLTLSVSKEQIIVGQQDYEKNISLPSHVSMHEKWLVHADGLAKFSLKTKFVALPQR